MSEARTLDRATLTITEIPEGHDLQRLAKICADMKSVGVTLEIPMDAMIDLLGPDVIAKDAATWAPKGPPDTCVTITKPYPIEAP